MHTGVLYSVIMVPKSSPVSLLQTIESLRAQTHKRMRILAVGHDRASREICRSRKVLWVQCPQGASESVMRNAALPLLLGEFASFLVQGDLWEPNKTQKQLSFIKGRKNMSAVCVNGLLPKKNQSAPICIFSSIPKDGPQILKDNTIQTGSQLIYRTQALLALFGFDENLSVLCDADAVIRLMETGTVHFSDEPLFQAFKDPDGAALYSDNMHLIRVYEDWFLLNKALALSFYSRMVRLCRKNGLWLPMFAFSARAFMRAPLIALRFGVKKVFYWIWLFIMLVTGRFAAALRVISSLLHIKKDSHDMERKPPKTPKPPKHPKEPAPDLAAFLEHPIYCYARNRQLTRIVIPEGVTHIKEGMFYALPHLKEVVLPQSLVHIEAMAFMGCRFLTHVVIPSGSRLETIGSLAFADCRALESLTLPDGLFEISHGAFLGCKNLQDLAFVSAGQAGMPHKSMTNTLRRIGSFAFAGCAEITQMVFDRGSLLTKISMGTFYGCKRLRLLEFSGIIKRIEAYAFLGCVSLLHFGMTSIDLVDHIGQNSFKDCRMLTVIDIPYKLPRIRKSTYEGCQSLTIVRIPSRVRFIDKRAFANCTSLESVMLLSEKTIIAPGVFDGHVKVEVYHQGNDDVA